MCMLAHASMYNSSLFSVCAYTHRLGRLGVSHRLGVCPGAGLSVHDMQILRWAWAHGRHGSGCGLT